MRHRRDSEKTPCLTSARRRGGLFALVLATSWLHGGVGRADSAVALVSTPASELRAKYAGLYRYVGDASEQRLRLQAIARSADTFFIAVRGIVRDKLSDRTRIMPTFKLELGDGLIRSTVPGCSVAVSPESGEPARYRIGGDAIVLSQRFEGAHFVQTFTADEGGTRRNDFTLSPDGTLLTMHATLSSPRLPTPVVYTLTYRKAE